MNSIDTLTLEVADVESARAFYDAAFGALPIELRASDSATSGFRGYSVSLVVSQPRHVRAVFDAAVAAGATVLKPVTRSLWGVGAVVQAPDGTIWKAVTQSKKDTSPATGRPEVDEVVLLLGVGDVKASKAFYVDKGLTVGKSFGGKYAEFEAPAGSVKLALYPRKAAAKDAGVPADGSGSHRLAIRSGAGTFTDPDGYAWESVEARQDA